MAKNITEKKNLQKRIKKTGLPPGILLQTENNQMSIISLINYDKDSFREKIVKDIEECLVFKNNPTVTWINIDGSQNKEVLEKIGTYYDIHPLVLEDIMTEGQRPKIEDYGHYIFIVLKMIYPSKNNKEIIDEQLSLIIGNNFVFSFQEKPGGDPFNSIRDRIRNGLGKTRKMNASFLAYSLMDIIIDNYFIVLEKISEQIEELEDETLEKPTTQTLQKIHDMKREIIFFRKNVWPLREVVGTFNRSESGIIEQQTQVYIKDLYDHVIQLIDSIETFRDILSSILDIYLSSVNNKMNIIMKRLTLITTIFMPLTVIAGVFGMSEWSMMTGSQNWMISYPLFFIGLGIIGLITFLIFKKKGWM